MLMNPDQRQALQDQYVEKLKNFERDYKDSKDELQAKDKEITAKIVHDLAQVIRIARRARQLHHGLREGIDPLGRAEHRYHRPGDPQLQCDARTDRHGRRRARRGQAAASVQSEEPGASEPSDFGSQAAKKLDDFEVEPLDAMREVFPVPDDYETKVARARRVLGLLPHRYPFLLVDRVLELEQGPRRNDQERHLQRAVLRRTFPRHPVMPGVLIVEALAQSAAILALSEVGADPTRLFMLTGLDKVRFRRRVIPGDQLGWK